MVDPEQFVDYRTGLAFVRWGPDANASDDLLAVWNALSAGQRSPQARRGLIDYVWALFKSLSWLWLAPSRLRGHEMRVWTLPIEDKEARAEFGYVLRDALRLRTVGTVTKRQDMVGVHAGLRWEENRF